MKKILLFIALILSTYGVAMAQVGVGTETPHSSAALEVKSSSKGLLIPRLSLSERNAIVSPAKGLLIFQNDQDSGFYFFNGTEWISLKAGGLNADWNATTGATLIQNKPVLSQVATSGSFLDLIQIPDFLSSADTASMLIPYAKMGPVQKALDERAKLESPKFTGKPTAPNPLITDNSTQIATTAFVVKQISDKSAINMGQIYIGGPDNIAVRVALTGDISVNSSGLVTIKPDRIESAMIKNANITNAKLDKSNIPLSGFGATTSAELAAVISDEIGTGNIVLSDSPALTGKPTAPNPLITDNSTQIATTAFVRASTLVLNEVSDEVTSTNGQTEFALTFTPSARSVVKLFVNGLRMSKNVFTVSNKSINYISNNNGNYDLVAGDRIQIEYFTEEETISSIK